MCAYVCVSAFACKCACGYGCWCFGCVPVCACVSVHATQCMHACPMRVCVCVVSCRVVSCRVLSCRPCRVCVCLCVHVCACLCACTLIVLPSRFSTYPHTHAHTHTLRPGPGVEAHDAARPGRARRGVCGQLLRRAAETPEHVTPGHRDTGRHHIYETNVPETRFWYLNLFTICPSHYFSGCGEARSGGRSAPLKLTTILLWRTLVVVHTIDELDL